MEVIICEDKEKWNNWFLTCLPAGREQKQAEFLQSWEWGEFQAKTGKEVLRLQAVEKDEVVGQVQGFAHNLGFGFKYIYLARYMIRGERSEEILFNYLRGLGFVFVRFESKLPITNYQLPITTVSNRQPRQTLVLDITRSEDDLLSQMHSKTRYNIRLAERKGVVVKLEKNIDIFWQLNQETVGRDEFKSHSKSYYAKMLELENVYQLTAYYNDEPIAVNICVSFADTFTYLHGASSNQHRNLMAPYLLQWVGIKLAKKLNCKFYDFWGIAPVVGEDDAVKKTCFNNFCWRVDHKWTGITRFKTGFGGEVKEYPQAREIVFNKWKYKFYKLVRRII